MTLTDLNQEKDDEGVCTHLVGSLHDLTEVRRAEKEIRDLQHYNRELIEVSLDPLVTFDHKGCILDVNEATIQATGRSREELIGTPFADYFTDSEKAHKGVMMVFQMGEIRDYELVLKAKDGTQTIVSYNASVYKDQTGDVVGAFAAARNITTCKRVEEAMRESQEKYQALYDNAPLSYQSLNEDGCILDVNPAWLKTLGYEKEEVIGKWFGDFLHPDSKPHFEKNFSDFKKRGYVHDIQFKIRHKDGHYLDISFEGRIGYTLDGKFKQTYCVFQDITDRKDMEDQIKDSLREKEELLKEIHHRVGSNLQIISSILDLSNMQTTDQNAINILTEAHTKIHTMALIHSQLYQSTKFDQIDMEKYIRELVGFLSQIYTLKSINTVIECSGVYLSITHAIPCALVLNELISNAYKHAFNNEHKGTIEVSMQRYGDMICMKVKDDGIGIPDNIDIHKTDSLGLKLVRNLIQVQLKGEIQVNRENGTEFIIKCNFLKGDDKNV